MAGGTVQGILSWVPARTQLVLFLPPAFGLAENVRLLTDLAQTIAPALGWTPAS